MGYRLEISKIKYSTCGGKLYGYTDVHELKSWEWLLKNKYIDGDEYWSYGCNPQIVLDAEEFKKFIKLYLEDLDENYAFKEYLQVLKDELIKLSRTKCDKLLEWI